MGGVRRIVDRLLDGEVPLRTPDALREAVRLAREEAPLDPGAAAAAVSEVVGLGPLEPLLADPDVTDILVNGPDQVWVDRGGDLERVEVAFSGPDAVVAAVERAVAPLGLGVDRASPAVDARLPDGSRLHAIVPPASVDGPLIAIRKFTAAVPDLDALLGAGACTEPESERLRRAVRAGLNIIVCGATGAGKTTLLNVLAAEIPSDQRVVTIEEAAELSFPGHVVRLEARPPNAEGAGEITLQTLVRHALRMRPDRIVVGEVRGSEALDLIQAMSTGHTGSMGTVHASGPEEALWRLETLAVSGDRRVPEGAVRSRLHRTLDLVVHVVRRRGVRRIDSISTIGDGGAEG